MPSRLWLVATRNSQLAIPGLLAAVLYARVLTLPFYWDDVANFLWMEHRPLSSIWMDSTGFPFYRPLGFTLWRSIQLIAGPTHPFPFHAANLITHIVSGWLAGALAARFFVADSADDNEDKQSIRGRRSAALTAGALTIAFPFAAHVVPYVAVEFHLLVTAMSVGAVLCALQFRDTRRWRWAVVGLALAALAPFQHESGVVTGALMAIGVLLAPNRESGLAERRPPPGARRSNFIVRHAQYALPLVALIANLAYLPWWAHVPKTRAENFTWVGWESLFQSTVFFAEGLTFPIQFAARWLMGQLGWSDMLAVSALALFALAVAVVLCVTCGASRPTFHVSRFKSYASRAALRALAFALAYWLIAAAPSLIGLPFSYIIVSPRLQVFPSPAAAVLWTTVISLFAFRLSPLTVGCRRFATHACESPRAQRVGSQFAVLLTALLLVAPVMHILSIVRLHRYALDPLWTLAQAARDHPAEKQLIINAPNWVAPVRAHYALGHEGVEIIPGYLSPQLLAWSQAGLQAPIDGFAFPNVFPLLRDHYFDAWGKVQDWDRLAARLPGYDRVWLWKYTDERLVLQEVGAVSRGLPRQPDEFVASFDSRVWLTTARAALDRDAARLELTWQAAGPMNADVFTHVLDCAGNLLGQTDGAALGGTYPLWLWPVGVRVRDVRHVPLSALSLDGCYRIEIGLFNPADGTRPAALDPFGERYVDSVVVLQP